MRYPRLVVALPLALGLVASLAWWGLGMGSMRTGASLGESNIASGGAQEAKAGDGEDQPLLPVPNDVAICRSRLTSTEGETRVTTVRNLRRALECYVPTGAQALEVKMVRTALGALGTVVGTGRAKMVLYIGGDGGDGRREWKPPGVMGERPTGTPSSFTMPLNFPSVITMRKPLPAGGHQDEFTLIMKTKDKCREVPFGTNAIACRFALGESSYGVFKKVAVDRMPDGEGTSWRDVGLVIINGAKLEVANEIALPTGLATANILYVLDPKNLVVVAIEEELNWLMIIELPPVRK